MVSSQDLGFDCFVVGVAAFVVAASLAAGAAAVALSAVLEAETDQVRAAAMVTSNCSSDHENNLP